MNCYDLLQEVKNIKNFKSDNELSKFLGITRQSIHGIKNGGGFNDDIALKVADITGRNLAEILLIREISRKHNELRNRETSTGLIPCPYLSAVKRLINY